MLFRTLAILVLIGLLWALGIIDPGGLPWDSQEFRVSGATVLIYLVWSAVETVYRRGRTGLPYAVFYSVLLVTALDSFLLELTTWSSPWSLRWAGLLIFAAGSGLRIRAFRLGSAGLLRAGRYLQLAGLPSALGSVAGLVLAAVAGIPGSVHEEPGQQEDAELDEGAS
ncbi:MAG: hypothetical protein AVO35_00820 [Candidatus Aegiribacteria sp. MLS_C]|nr:MAG: hypothetical protein AVO35_00820 [Candidatus Aegiribacteria sp. MLS_C]